MALNNGLVNMCEYWTANSGLKVKDIDLAVVINRPTTDNGMTYYVDMVCSAWIFKFGYGKGQIDTKWDKSRTFSAYTSISVHFATCSLVS